MAQKTENAPLQVVYIVTCYQSVVGVYASQEDAAQCQREFIVKNRPADVLCRTVSPDTKL